MHQETVRKIATQSEDGRMVTVYEHKVFREAGLLAGPSWMEVDKFLQLDNGSPVNCIDPNTFQVLGTGLVLRKV